MTDVAVVTWPSLSERAATQSLTVTDRYSLSQVRLSVVDPARQATTLAENHPPYWMEDVVYSIQGSGALPKVEREFLQRLARAISQLPRNTPMPQVGIGDDGSVALEWDIDELHLGIQVDPDESYDAVFLDVAGDAEVSEAPLSLALGHVARFFMGIRSRRD